MARTQATAFRNTLPGRTHGTLGPSTPHGRCLGTSGIPSYGCQRREGGAATPHSRHTAGSRSSNTPLPNIEGYRNDLADPPSRGEPAPCGAHEASPDKPTKRATQDACKLAQPPRKSKTTGGQRKRGTTAFAHVVLDLPVDSWCAAKCRFLSRSKYRIIMRRNSA